MAGAAQVTDLHEARGGAQQQVAGLDVSVGDEERVQILTTQLITNIQCIARCIHNSKVFQRNAVFIIDGRNYQNVLAICKNSVFHMEY